MSPSWVWPWVDAVHSLKRKMLNKEREGFFLARRGHKKGMPGGVEVVGGVVETCVGEGKGIKFSVQMHPWHESSSSGAKRRAQCSGTLGPFPRRGNAWA